MGKAIVKALNMGISFAHLLVLTLFGLFESRKENWVGRGVVLDKNNLPAEIKRALTGVGRKPLYRKMKRNIVTAGAELVYFCSNPDQFAGQYGLTCGFFECENILGINVYKRVVGARKVSGGPVPYQQLECKVSPWFDENGKRKIVLMYKAFVKLNGKGRMKHPIEESLGGRYVYMVSEKNTRYMDVNVYSITWEEAAKVGFRRDEDGKIKGAKKILRRIFRHTGVPEVTRNMIAAGGYVDPDRVAINWDVHKDGCALMTTKFANRIARTQGKVVEMNNGTVTLDGRIKQGDTAMGQMMGGTFKKMMWIFVDKIQGHPEADIMLYGRHFVSKAHVQPMFKGCHVSFWKHRHNFRATVNLGMASVLEGVGKAIIQDLKVRIDELKADPEQVLVNDSRMPLIRMLKKFGVKEEYVKLMTLVRARGALMSKFKMLDGTEKKYRWRLRGTGSGHIMGYHHETMKGVIPQKQARWLQSLEGKSFKELNGVCPVVINKDGTLLFTTLKMADTVFHHRFDTADFDDTAHVIKVGETEPKRFKAVMYRFPVRRNGVIYADVWDSNSDRDWTKYDLEIIWGKYSNTEDPFECAPKDGNVVVTDPEDIKALEAKYVKACEEYAAQEAVTAEELRKEITKKEEELINFGAWFLIHLACRFILNYHRKFGIRFSVGRGALVITIASISPSDVLDWSLGLANLPEDLTREGLLEGMETFKDAVRNGELLAPRSMARVNPRALGVWSADEEQYADFEGEEYKEALASRTFEDEYEQDNVQIQEILKEFKATIDNQIDVALDAAEELICPGGGDWDDVNSGAWHLGKRIGAIHWQMGELAKNLNNLGLSKAEKNEFWRKRQTALNHLTRQMIDNCLPKAGSYKSRRRYVETLGWHLFEFMVIDRKYRYFTHDRGFDLACMGLIRERAGMLGAFKCQRHRTGQKSRWYDQAVKTVVGLTDVAFSMIGISEHNAKNTLKLTREIRWCNRIAGRDAAGNFLDEDQIDALNEKELKSQRDWDQRPADINPELVKEVNEFIKSWYENEFVKQDKTEEEDENVSSI